MNLMKITLMKIKQTFNINLSMEEKGNYFLKLTKSTVVKKLIPSAPENEYLKILSAIFTGGSSCSQ